MNESIDEKNRLPIGGDFTDNDDIVLSKEAIRYIAGWLVMDATQYHDVLESMKDFEDQDILTEAIEAAIEAWNGGARDE